MEFCAGRPSEKERSGLIIASRVRRAGGGSGLKICGEFRDREGATGTWDVGDAELMVAEETVSGVSSWYDTRSSRREAVSYWGRAGG